MYWLVADRHGFECPLLVTTRVNMPGVADRTAVGMPPLAEREDDRAVLVVGLHVVIAA